MSKVSDIQCYHKGCPKNPKSGHTLFRVNKVGELPAVWSCRDHMPVPIDSTVDKITQAIEKDNGTKL